MGAVQSAWSRVPSVCFLDWICTTQVLHNILLTTAGKDLMQIILDHDLISSMCELFRAMFCPYRTCISSVAVEAVLSVSPDLSLIHI